MRRFYGDPVGTPCFARNDDEGDCCARNDEDIAELISISVMLFLGKYNQCLNIRSLREHIVRLNGYYFVIIR